MEIGLLIPQGYFGEFDGWEPARAWTRMQELSRLGAAAGFRSLWLGEHVLSKWDASSIAFDGFTAITGLAASVPDVELGLVVLNSTFRNPALTAKMAGTADAIAGGRLILGLGAGFRQVEADAFGFPYPELPERMAMLSEHFAIVSQLTRQGHAPFSYGGAYASTAELVNAPATSGRDHIPLLIGGHGRNVTFRLAARYCDEISINVRPDAFTELRAVLADRCAEVERDPATLRVGSAVPTPWPFPGLRTTGRQRMMVMADLPATLAQAGPVATRPEELAAWKELGLDRFIIGAPGMADTDEAFHELLEDLEAVGLAPRPADR